MNAWSDNEKDTSTNLAVSFELIDKCMTNVAYYCNMHSNAKVHMDMTSNRILSDVF
jgi:hypothetical protein